MGLVKAASKALKGVLADQWREYFYCEALPREVLVRRGQKRQSRGSNRGDNNIISNGSIIAVADGQCMCIVEQGKVVDFCAEAGEYVFDLSAEPSLFTGDLGDSILDSFQTLGRRLSFGGESARDQRVYYFNTLELTGNRYGTPNQVPFRVVDQRAGIDMDIGLRCFGEYSYRLADPLLFYTKVCGNVAYEYRREELDSQLKSELLSALQPAFARLSQQGLRYSELLAHTTDLCEALKTELSSKWRQERGLELCQFGMNSLKATEEDEAILKELQRNAAFADPTRAAAHLVGAQAEAMKAAAANKNAGPAMAFMGMNAAAQAGGANIGNLFALGQQAQQGWTCSCGAVNQGNFCPNCGKRRPQNAPLYRCDKCGWQPEDPAHPPKFCPNCGDPFDEEDKQ